MTDEKRERERFKDYISIACPLNKATWQPCRAKYTVYSIGIRKQK